MIVQDEVVMAFCKRLKNRGYIDIDIIKIDADTYSVSLVEPFAQTIIKRIMSCVEMHWSMRF